MPDVSQGDRCRDTFNTYVVGFTQKDDRLDRNGRARPLSVVVQTEINAVRALHYHVCTRWRVSVIHVRAHPHQRRPWKYLARAFGPAAHQVLAQDTVAVSVKGESECRFAIS